MAWPSVFTECNCTTIIFAGMLCVIISYLLRRRRNDHFPPGPAGLPLVGYAPFLGDHGAESLRKLKSKYGPYMSIRLGMEHWVVLNDYDTIHECLVKQGETFSGRTNNEIVDKITWGKGIVFSDYGSTWKNLRKFGMTTLRGFGVGKKGMEEHIIEETPYLIEELTGIQKPHMKLTNAVSNIICRVTFGDRFDYNDKTFSYLTRLFRDFVADNMDTKLFGLASAAPILQHFPIFRGALQRVMAHADAILGILRGLIQNHRDTFDKEDIRDFIDAFLAKIEERGSHDESFNEEQLLQYIRDLFEAGSGTTSSTLTWGILALVNYPECQEKIADEIHKTIGDSGLPSMKHRVEMNYTCAFIHELMRHRTLVPTSILHKTNAKAVINGYTIPKDTPIVANIWAVHHDPELFENPAEFKPERFLNEDGKFVKSNYIIPFSVGPRQCLGEQLARMEIFIFLTGIVQKLKILRDPLNPPPHLYSGSLAFLMTFEPPEFSVNFERR